MLSYMTDLYLKEYGSRLSSMNKYNLHSQIY